MNKNQFEGLWHQLKGKAKEKWGELSDDDLTKVDGKIENLYGVVQDKYGYTKEQAQEEVDNYFEFKSE